MKGEWSVVKGEWSVVKGEWSVVKGEWSIVKGEWSVVKGEWSVVKGGEWSVVKGEWSVVKGEWSVVKGEWSVVSRVRVGGGEGSQLSIRKKNGESLIFTLRTLVRMFYLLFHNPHLTNRNNDKIAHQFISVVSVIMRNILLELWTVKSVRKEQTV